MSIFKRYLTRQLLHQMQGIPLDVSQTVFDSFDGNDGERQGILASLSQQTMRSQQAKKRNVVGLLPLRHEYFHQYPILPQVK
jgi:hypothetical protein